MRQLTQVEMNAARWLAKNTPFCPGDMVQSDAGKEVKRILDGLVRKRAALVEATDDGPAYHAVSR